MRDLRMELVEEPGRPVEGPILITGFLSFFTAPPKGAQHAIHGRPQAYPQL